MTSAAFFPMKKPRMCIRGSVASAMFDAHAALRTKIQLVLLAGSR